MPISESVGGSVVVTQKNDTFLTLSYRLTGLIGAKGTEGGLHIHEKASCYNAGLHFYNSTLYSQDPWTSLKWKIGDSVAEGSFDVAFGHSLAEVMNRTVVVHNSAGDKVACGVIADGTVAGDVFGIATFTHIHSCTFTPQLHLLSVSHKHVHSYTLT